MAEHPTQEQLRRLAYVIRCEDDYLSEDRFAVQFAHAVLALWGRGGYVHTFKPTDHQLSVLSLLSVQAATYKPTPSQSQTVSSLLIAVIKAISIAADCEVTAESWQPEARAAIRAVAEWLDTKGQHGCSLWLREELQ